MRLNTTVKCKYCYRLGPLGKIKTVLSHFATIFRNSGALEVIVL